MAEKQGEACRGSIEGQQSEDKGQFQTDNTNQNEEDEEPEDTSDKNSIENEYMGLSQEALNEAEAQAEERRRNSVWKLYTLLQGRPR